MWRERIITASLSVIALGLAGLIGGYLWTLSAINAPGPLQAATTVIISPGSGLSAITRDLAAADVIARPWLFEFEARRSNQARILKPGEYSFDPGISLAQVLSKLVRREVVGRNITIPEGLVTAEIAAILATAEGLTGDFPVTVAEGSLLPETYRYEWGDTRAELVARMKAAHDRALGQLWTARKDGLPLDAPDEAVILASIVEKETGVAEERGRVAAVFVNRLNKRMRLQSDPTVIYGIAPGGLGRPLTRADLEQPSPYNTYTIDRLPPGPICHPGRDALAAVLMPPDTGDLYFVADGSGGHAFAATLDEHNRNVARWRKIDRQNTATEIEPPAKAPAPPPAAAKPSESKPKPKGEARPRTEASRAAAPPAKVLAKPPAAKPARSTPDIGGSPPVTGPPRANFPPG